MAIARPDKVVLLVSKEVLLVSKAVLGGKAVPRAKRPANAKASRKEEQEWIKGK